MKKKRLLVGLLVLAIFVAFTLFVKRFDVKAVGDQNVVVGCAFINGLFNSILGFNGGFYSLSNYFGYLAFLICAIYGVIGLIQLIARKKVQKVDKEILLLGCLYVLILILKIVFDNFIVINTRPLSVNGVFEASYPSSHTFMALVVCGSSIVINKKKYDNSFFARIGNYVSLSLMVVIIVTRFLSGVHWFTDIIGSVILSFGLILIYSGLITSNDEIEK